MIESVFDGEGRLVSPIEYPLPNLWDIVDETQLRDFVENESSQVPTVDDCVVVPWTCVKNASGTVLPALQFAREINDMILVSNNCITFSF